MEIVLVRHGLPLRVELETGIADPELAAEGHEQAEKMAAYLGVEDVEAVYVTTASSPNTLHNGRAVSSALRSGLTYMASTSSTPKYAAILAACSWPSAASSGSAMPVSNSIRIGRPCRTKTIST